jgi:hypothetical protein
MKTILITAALVLSTLGAAAQGIAGVSQRLARADYGGPGGPGGATIEVEVTPEARTAISSADLSPSRSSITAYGVRLLIDNSQQGRANAYGVEAKFEELYPGIGAEVTYETPAFWVTAGCFVDRLDAVALCGRVLGQFRTAFVVPMEVPVSRIIAKEKPEPAE